MRIQVSVVSVFIVLIIAFNLIFSFHQIRGNSMNSALNSGDMMICYNGPVFNLLKHRLGSLRDRIVVLRVNGRFTVKRCVGLPGDTLIFSLQSNTDTFTVPRGKIFVLGDNIHHSTDSRLTGAIDMDSVYSVPLFVCNSPVKGRVQ
ncbi:MAG: S26 family signal peptidase [bacterium]